MSNFQRMTVATYSFRILGGKNRGDIFLKRWQVNKSAWKSIHLRYRGPALMKRGMSEQVREREDSKCVGVQGVTERSSEGGWASTELPIKSGRRRQLGVKTIRQWALIEYFSFILHVLLTHHSKAHWENASFMSHRKCGQRMISWSRRWYSPVSLSHDLASSPVTLSCCFSSF